MSEPVSRNIEPRSAIVFVVDGLRAATIGCYGNTTFPTESFDELAADSLLFEWVFVDTPDVEQALRSVFYRTHPCAPQQENHLVETVAQLGGYSILFTDDSALAESEMGAAFDRSIIVERPVRTRSALHPGETHFANFFAKLLEVTLAMEPGTLLWVHCQGMYGDWDAPLKYRQRHSAPEDPEPPTFVAVPQLSIADREISADELLGYQQAYAAQVSLFDEMLGHYLSQAKPIIESVLFCMTSLRGFPLGEHLDVGESQNLYSENLHVPMLIKTRYQEDRSFRSQSLSQPRIIYDVVKDWFAAADHPESLRLATKSLPIADTDFSISVTTEAVALCTHFWKLIRSEDELKLYVKPDDRWEINDVNSRCVEIVQKMNGLLSDCESLLREGIDQLNSVRLPSDVAERLE